MTIPSPFRTFAAGAISLALSVAAVANPVLVGADPHAAVIGKEYWIYPTNSVDPKARSVAERFYGYSSRDLRDWKKSRELIDMADISWIKDDGAKTHFLWAPAIVEANGNYYFYYSVGPQDPTPSRIGVATGSSPAGPFRDSGRPLLTGGSGFEAIDPMVFVDPKTSVPYLYAGGSNGSKLRVFRLRPNMIEIEREIPVRQPPLFTEGAFMHERNGVYYLSYSHGRWNDATYSVHYATGSSPEGPWVYRGPVLASDASHKGPGHHSFIRNPSTGDWFIAYHRWERRDLHGPFRGVRQTAIEPIRYSADNRIEWIRMTNDGPPSSPIN